MKKIILGTFAIVFILIIIFTIYTFHGRSIRQTELNNALTSSMTEAMQMLEIEREVSAITQDEWIASFLENLSMQIESYSDLTVNILVADMEKGILSVEAILTFKHPIGSMGSVSETKTVIIETYDTQVTKQKFQVVFTVDGEIYKTYILEEGSSLLPIASPTVNGKTFVGWRNTESGNIESLSGRTISSNLTFDAVFN